MNGSFLLLCDYDPFQAQMVQDSIHALSSRSSHNISTLSFRGNLPSDLDLNRFDGIVIHYSLFIYDRRYLSDRSRERLKAFRGSKAIFLQDEYKHVRTTTDVMAELGINIVFTCFDDSAAQQVYRCLPAVRLVPVLTGYVTDALLAIGSGPPISARSIDVSYRGRRYPAWHGSLGQDRVRIAEAVVAAARARGLKEDISVSETDRLYGEKWLDLLRRSRAVLGTESGSSVVDLDGSIERAVHTHLALHPDASFEELRARYFADKEGRIPLAQISPRIFEAIACGAALILYEGNYSGRLEPQRHYIALRKDHSNLAETMSYLEHPDNLAAMTARARSEVLEAPQNHEAALVELFDRELTRAIAGRGRRAGYPRAEFLQRYGRYDSVWRRTVLTRQVFRMGLRLYDGLMKVIPPRWRHLADLRIRYVFHRLRRNQATDK